MLAPELAEYYRSHGVDGVENYLSSSRDNQTGKRFVRLNPRFDANETLRLLKDELPPNSPVPSQIPWLDPRLGFFAIPASFKLAQSQTFISGRIYGMDVSSGATVAALLFDDFRIDTNKQSSCNSKNAETALLNETAGMRVLDLCCSPGLKLCTIADILAKTQSTVVGVDVSEQRMAVCRNVVKKYQIATETSGRGTKNAKDPSPRIRLYCEDGSTFWSRKEPPNLVFDSLSAQEEVASAGKRKRMNKSARARERKRLRQMASLDMVDVTAPSATVEKVMPQGKMELYDRVLVDAECSTDGAVRHMLHKADSSNPAKNETLACKEQLSELVNLQRQLIESGFKLLKPGGIMVYSTCSLSQAQNESVVSWLLDNYPREAALIPVPIENTGAQSFVSEGSVSGTVRFHPNVSDSESLFGGGLFLAKIKRCKTT